MEYILTGKEMAAADRYTSEVIGIPSLVLMERAALSVADEITQREGPSPGRRITFVCGPGNNGADGIAAGRILTDRGFDIQFLLLSGKPPAEGSSMERQLSILGAYGIRPEVFSASAAESFRPDVIVDAMFGTGLVRPLQGKAEEAVLFMEKCRAERGTVIAGLDIPSGVSADDGSILGCAPHCDYTVTFAFRKRGHLLFPGSEYCGETVLRQIGITERSLESIPAMYVMNGSDVGAILPHRPDDGNKGTFGKVLLIAGSLNMCGAAVLAARAVMRSGAGMVRVFTCEENRVIVQSAFPEALLTTYTDADSAENALEEVLPWADVAAAGPGMGRTETAKRILRKLFGALRAGREDQGSEEKSKEIAQKDRTGSLGRLRALVLDADALRLIAADPSLGKLLSERRKDVGCVLTPHLMEFADLMGISLEECLTERDRSVRELAQRYKCSVICKDARTMVASAGREDVCLITNGCSGMGTAGSGDVLTGITAAMAAGTESGLPMHGAASAAAWIHAEAGRLAAQTAGNRGMTASDICGAVGAALRSVEGLNTERRHFNHE